MQRSIKTTQDIGSSVYDLLLSAALLRVTRSPSVMARCTICSIREFRCARANKRATLFLIARGERSGWKCRDWLLKNVSYKRARSGCALSRESTIQIFTRDKNNKEAARLILHFHNLIFPRRCINNFLSLLGGLIGKIAETSRTDDSWSEEQRAFGLLPRPPPPPSHAVRKNRIAIVGRHTATVNGSKLEKGVAESDFEVRGDHGWSEEQRPQRGSVEWSALEAAWSRPRASAASIFLETWTFNRSLSAPK